MDLFPAFGAGGRALRRRPGARRTCAQVEVATFRSDHDLRGRPPSRQGAIRNRSARGRAAPRLHHQRPDDGSRIRAKCSTTSEAAAIWSAGDPRHRRPGDAVSRGSSAHAARHPFRRAPRLRDRPRNLRRRCAPTARADPDVSPPSGCATSWFASSPRAARGAVSKCWTNADCCAEILPEVAAMKGVEQPPEYHPEGDVWIHTLLLLEQLRASDAYAGAGRAAARRRQAADIPAWRSGSASTAMWRRARRWRRRSFEAAIFARADRPGGGAGSESHEVHGCAPDEGEHVEAIPAAAVFRGAPGAASPGLPLEQPQAREL